MATKNVISTKAKAKPASARGPRQDKRSRITGHPHSRRPAPVPAESDEFIVSLASDGIADRRAVIRPNEVSSYQLRSLLGAVFSTGKGTELVPLPRLSEVDRHLRLGFSITTDEFQSIGQWSYMRGDTVLANVDLPVVDGDVVVVLYLDWFTLMSCREDEEGTLRFTLMTPSDMPEDTRERTLGDDVLLIGPLTEVRRTMDPRAYAAALAKHESQTGGVQ